MTKKDWLLKRGFSEYDIKTNFKYYKGEWNINTITKEQVMAATTAAELMRLFYKDSVDNTSICATHIGRNFDAFANDCETFDVSPSQLDPNIARLCRAANNIGVKTCMSCDGWHKSNSSYTGMKLYMKDRYSVIWFWLITEYIFGEHWCHSNPYQKSWRNIWEVFDNESSIFDPSPRDMMVCSYSLENTEEAMTVFYKNNCYAKFIEKYTDKLLTLKKQIIDSLYERMKSGDIPNIDDINFMKVRKYMYDAFQLHSDTLIEAFREEYYEIIRINDELYNNA